MQRLLGTLLGGVVMLSAACGPSVTTVSMTPLQANISAKGEKVTLRAEPLDKEGKQVVDAILKLQWSSSNAEVASVSPNGVVTALKSGDAQITAAVGEVRGVTTVAVTIPATLTLDPDKTEIVGVKKAIALKPIVKDGVGRDVPNASVLWSTSDGTVATVDEGTITAQGAGTATIKAACGEASGTASIVVSHPPVEGIALEPASQVLEKVGDAVRLKANLTDASGQPILGLNPAWTSADPRVATVSDTGQVQAVRRGRTLIKATAGDKSAEAQIVVK